RQFAQVIVEPGAVRAEPNQLAVVVRSLLQSCLDERLVLVEKRCQPIQLIYGARQWRPRSAEELGDRGGPGAQRVDGGTERIPVLGESADKPLKAIDSAGELVAVFGECGHHRVEVVDQLLDHLSVI